MAEFTEFAEALLDQISVEIDEEKEIAKLSEKINDDPEFPNQFTELESFSREIFPEISRKVKDFTGFTVKPNLRVEFPELKEFKLLKGKKVFATKQSRDFVDELFSAVSDLDISNCEIEYIVDMQKVIEAGVVNTPAVVIDETIVVSGRAPETKELTEIISKYK